MNHEDTNKSFVIHITDQRLLNTTGGIVQGMSGSPILQNGKVIGAVTHVFVQDAASGYGIFIEKHAGACLKKAFCKMCVTICGIFCPDEGAVAGYGN